MTPTRRRRRGGGLLAATVAALAVVTAPMTAVEAAVTDQNAVKIIQIRGSGTTNPSKLFWWAMDKLEERAGSPVRLTYRSVGSGTGEADWADHTAGGTTGGDPDFASTDYGLPADSTKPFLQIPFQIGAVSVFVNLPGVKTGDIKLSACTVANIFKGVITSWDDAAIKADSGLTLPAQTIKVVYRTNGSSSTQGIKGYMQAGCTDFSSLTVDSTPLTGTHLNPGQYGVTGSDEMRKKIGANEYSIGYIDAGHGHKDDLTEVALKNLDGQWVVTKSGDPGGFVTANIPAVVTPSLKATFPGGASNTNYAGDWSGVNLFNKAGDKVWPICAFTYMHIRQSYSDPETGGLVRAFAEFVLESEVQGVVENFLFHPLDSTFAAEAKDALSGLPDRWTFEYKTGKDADEGALTRAVTNGLKTFSKRRSNYADYHRELLVADIAQLEASVAALETKVAGMKTNDDSTEKSALALGAVAFVSALIANILAGFALRRGGGRSKSYGGGASYATSAAPTPAYDAHRVIVAPTAYAEPAPVSSPAPVSYNAGPASSPAVAALPLAPAHGEENA
jgi:ABC-type phosphate transport system substrate-binding protein